MAVLLAQHLNQRPQPQQCIAARAAAACPARRLQATGCGTGRVVLEHSATAPYDGGHGGTEAWAR